MLTKLLAPVSAKIIAALGVLTLLSLSVASCEHRRANRLSVALETTKVAYRTAQASAEAYAKANKARVETANLKRKERSDEALFTARTADRARTDQFIAANRVRCQAAEGPRGNADLPPTPTAAEVDHRPSGVAELAAVAPKDLHICTVNSRRVQNAHEWGLSQ